MVTLGEIIKTNRKKKGFTLVELGEKVGVTHGYLSNIENNVRSTPSVDVVRKIADALEFSRSSLLTVAGYVEEAELESMRGIISRKIKDGNVLDLEEVNSEVINLEHIIDAAFLDTVFIYQEKELDWYEKAYIAEILSIILENSIPVEKEEKDKVLNVLHALSN